MVISFRRMAVALLVLPLVCSVAGCDDIDWNWDTTWWKRPKRVVRPRQQNTAKPTRTDHSGQPDVTPDQARRAEPESPRHSKPAGAGVSGTVASPTGGVDSPTGSIAAAPKPRTAHRSFYQLYLLSGARKAPSEERGEYAVRLEHARARPCSGLLEMAYVPVGRSGSEDECYLLYENRAEFEAAVALVKSFDVAPLDAAPASVGAEASFRSGTGLFLRILEQGALADRDLVDACEHRLAAATQTRQLPPLHRWAAGVLAGRLVAEYRYDYAAARSYYSQAERAAAPASIEHMTTRWWYADAFMKEGGAQEAVKVYKEILDTYGGKWKDAQIVRRTKAILDKHAE